MYLSSYTYTFMYIVVTLKYILLCLEGDMWKFGEKMGKVKMSVT
jgi:hypothetical protein